MNSSLFDWSNVLLMDSLTKKPCRRSRRLMAKLRKTSMPHRQVFGRPKFGQKFVKRINKANDRNNNGWKEKYETWNLVTETLKHHMVSNHKIHRDNDDIGILNSHTNTIQLIHDRQQFNQLMLVDSNGLTAYAKNVIDPNGSGSSGSKRSLKLKFRLIPVIEGITVANNCVESTYTFGAGINENNNNDADLTAVPAKMDKASETDSTLLYEMESSEAASEFTDMFARINNVTAAPGEYAEFIEEIQSKVANTLNSNSDRAPMCSTPRKVQPLISNGLFDTPAPRTIHETNPFNINGALSICEVLKKLTGNMRNILNQIENVCSKLIGPNCENLHRDFSTTGNNYFSDSIKV